MKVILILSTLLITSLFSINEEWITEHFEIDFEITNEQLLIIADENHMKFSPEYIYDDSLDESPDNPFFIYEAWDVYEVNNNFYVLLYYVCKNSKLLLLINREGSVVERFEVKNKGDSISGIFEIGNDKYIKVGISDYVELDGIAMKMIENSEHIEVEYEFLKKYYPQHQHYYEKGEYYNRYTFTTNEEFIYEINNDTYQLNIFNINNQEYSDKVNMNFSQKTRPDGSYFERLWFVFRDSENIFLNMYEPEFFIMYNPSTENIQYIQLDDIRRALNISKLRDTWQGWLNYGLCEVSGTFYIIMETLDGITILKYK